MTEAQRHWPWGGGPSDEAEFQLDIWMGRMECVAWAMLLGIPGSVEGRNEIGLKEGIFVVHQNFVSFFRELALCLDSIFVFYQLV